MKALDTVSGTFKKVYVKALDSLPVGTEVDFNGQAGDIPAGWEAVSDKSIMTSGISASFSTVAGTWTKMPNQVLTSSIGNKFTFSNEAIIIGDGVSNIKAMASCQYMGTAGGYAILELVRKRNNVETRVALAVGTATQENTITTCMQIIDVQKNDEIYLKYITANVITISADSTKLYVEEV